ncbi:unnamed protein product [Gordionus sp. m RMFG-2023]|uniref:putative uncharacterized protein DDB_G0282133 isoform X2 n=1 Tax=Gordionus sp. m RMFG-2023 TaxID=3053472 RepID=UPI0030E309BF
MVSDSTTETDSTTLNSKGFVGNGHHVLSCSTFIRNVWKKELCVNCCKSECDHARTRSQNIPTKLIGDQIPEDRLSPSYIQKKRVVRICQEPPAIIGYDGGTSPTTQGDDTNNLEQSGNDFQNGDDEEAEDEYSWADEADRKWSLQTILNTERNAITKNLNGTALPLPSESRVDDFGGENMITFKHTKNTDIHKIIVDNNTNDKSEKYNNNSASVPRKIDNIGINNSNKNLAKNGLIKSNGINVLLNINNDAKKDKKISTSHQKELIDISFTRNFEIGDIKSINNSFVAVDTTFLTHNPTKNTDQTTPTINYANKPNISSPSIHSNHVIVNVAVGDDKMFSRKQNDFCDKSTPSPVKVRSWFERLDIKNLSPSAKLLGFSSNVNRLSPKAEVRQTNVKRTTSTGNQLTDDNDSLNAIHDNGHNNYSHLPELDHKSVGDVNHKGNDSNNPPIFNIENVTLVNNNNTNNETKDSEKCEVRDLLAVIDTRSNLLKGLSEYLLDETAKRKGKEGDDDDGEKSLLQEIAETMLRVVTNDDVEDSKIDKTPTTNSTPKSDKQIEAEFTSDNLIDNRSFLVSKGQITDDENKSNFVSNAINDFNANKSINLSPIYDRIQQPSKLVPGNFCVSKSLDTPALKTVHLISKEEILDREALTSPLYEELDYGMSNTAKGSHFSLIESVEDGSQCFGAPSKNNNSSNDGSANSQTKMDIRLDKSLSLDNSDISHSDILVIKDQPVASNNSASRGKRNVMINLFNKAITKGSLTSVNTFNKRNTREIRKEDIVVLFSPQPENVADKQSKNIESRENESKQLLGTNGFNISSAHNSIIKFDSKLGIIAQNLNKNCSDTNLARLHFCSKKRAPSAPSSLSPSSPKQGKQTYFSPSHKFSTKFQNTHKTLNINDSLITQKVYARNELSNNPSEKSHTVGPSVIHRVRSASPLPFVPDAQQNHPISEITKENTLKFALLRNHKDPRKTIRSKSLDKTTIKESQKHAQVQAQIKFEAQKSTNVLDNPENFHEDTNNMNLQNFVKTMPLPENTSCTPNNKTKLNVQYVESSINHDPIHNNIAFSILQNLKKSDDFNALANTKFSSLKKFFRKSSSNTIRKGHQRSSLGNLKGNSLNISDKILNDSNMVSVGTFNKISEDIISNPALFVVDSFSSEENWSTSSNSVEDNKHLHCATAQQNKVIQTHFSNTPAVITNTTVNGIEKKISSCQVTLSTDKSDNNRSLNVPPSRPLMLPRYLLTTPLPPIPITSSHNWVPTNCYHDQEIALKSSIASSSAIALTNNTSSSSELEFSGEGVILKKIPSGDRATRIIGKPKVPPPKPPSAILLSPSKKITSPNYNNKIRNNGDSNSFLATNLTHKKQNGTSTTKITNQTLDRSKSKIKPKIPIRPPKLSPQNVTKLSVGHNKVHEINETQKNGDTCEAEDKDDMSDMPRRKPPPPPPILLARQNILI